MTPSFATAARNARSVCVLVMAAALASSAAWADEAWDTPEGPIVYLSDEVDTAVFSFDASDGEVRFYFPGLAGNYENRDVHNGYWVKVDSVPSDQGTLQTCGIGMVGLDGFESDQWGTATVIFQTPSYPSDFVITAGACTEAHDRALPGLARLSD